MKKSWLLAAVMMLAASFARAYDTTPLQIGIWPPALQVVTPEINVSGLKLNLPFGGNDSITGIDLGLASSSNDCSAIQINAFVNSVNNDFAGIQVGCFNLCGNVGGLQVGLFNSTDKVTSGLQIGLLNTTMEMNGVQVGLVNYTQFLTGFQFGLINIATESIIPGMIILNFCF